MDSLLDLTGVALTVQHSSKVPHTFLLSTFGRALWPFINAINSAKTLILERWTQDRYDRGENISFPRLSMSPSRDTDNNYQDSDFLDSQC